MRTKIAARKKISMGRRCLILRVPLLFSCFLIFVYTGKSSEVCISQGIRFPSFSLEGKRPTKSSKGPKDLVLCRVFRQKTCCDVSQTYPALVMIRRLASSGEANQDCLDLWELLECSICDPRVGVHPGPPRICASLCDKVFQACGDAYFSVDPKTNVLTPCGYNDILCGRASKWTSNGTELCELAGFIVQQDGISYRGADEPFCYGGKSSLESVSESWKPSGSYSAKDDSVNFQQRLKEIPMGVRILWAVGGMVLTAGILFLSKRKSYGPRQRKAVMYLAAQRRLDETSNRQKSSTVKRK